MIYLSLLWGRPPLSLSWFVLAFASAQEVGQEQEENSSLPTALCLGAASSMPKLCFSAWNSQRGKNLGRPIRPSQ